MTQYWSKPKLYGYGAAPANWRGWIATATFVAVLLSASVVLLASQQNSPSDAVAWQIGAWLLTVAVLGLGLSGWRTPRSMENGYGAGESRCAMT